jgi:AcrR family transcriptional regulator
MSKHPGKNAKPPAKGANQRSAKVSGRGAALPLSRQRIVAAALRLVEREGLAAFSMRKLGDALGVEAMSLYHFFPSKQHLADAMVDAAISTVEFAPASAPALEQLRVCSRGYRNMARRHARLFQLIAIHRLNTPTGVAFIERVLAIVRGVAGDDETAARHFRTLGYYLTGAALDETSGYAKGPSAAEPVSDEYVAAHCPQLARSARFFKEEEWERTFELGLEALLEAAQPGSSKT